MVANARLMCFSTVRLDKPRVLAISSLFKNCSRLIWYIVLRCGGMFCNVRLTMDFISLMLYSESISYCKFCGVDNIFLGIRANSVFLEKIVNFILHDGEYVTAQSVVGREFFPIDHNFKNTFCAISSASY